MTRRTARFNQDSMTIDIVDQHGGVRYEMDLERMDDAGMALDFILQVNGKAWATPELMKEILDNLEKACSVILGNNAQGAFCPSGAIKKVKWPKARFAEKIQP